MKCIICEFEGEGKKFSNHLQKEHKISSKEYTRQYLRKDYNGCINCGKETRYVAFDFKKYCKDCSSIAMKEGGRKGGKSPAWNKGKTKADDSRIKGLSGENNSFWGKKHSNETKNRISMTKQLGSIEVLNRVMSRNEEFEILTPVEEYFSRQRQYLDFRCKKCDFVCKKTLQAFERGSLCPKCYPVNKSAAEIEIFEYIKSLGFDSAVNGDRNTINPKEIDVVIKQRNFGIEYNGLYWHSDIVDSTQKEDMLWKTQECKKVGIKLMHIFSDEWEHKQIICKSMIKNRLGICDKIWGRKCVLKEISKKEFDFFMNSSHISGTVNSSIRLGLFYSDELVSAIGFRKPRQKKWKDYYEISRFATKPNTVVVGGLGKFIKYYKNNYINDLMTYADRRFGEGLGYKKVGFQKYGETGIDYWYSDGRQRYDRFVVKAEGGKSEREKAAGMNLYKVWGCGSNIWVLE
tara:strand:+ start:545 stop:1924 length:1380 start_codon:yes stop_codon:yes gene_type:complete